MRQAVKAALSDADKSVDFTSVIQGHVSQQVRQVFTIERTRLRVHKRAQIEAHEHIVKDQFGNLYVVFTSRLMDGEVYACTAWVGAEKWTDTGRTIKLVREWKRFKTFNDDLLGAIQGLAFHALASANLAILKARHSALLLPLASNVSAN
jgi:hypothetical protein